ncbi:MAG TPA: nuclear transport factor 2 family protein [Chthonomonadales bacterium]|nr:nuclear transport factor 2 family protein [Chthonomonadales bacterium]
MKQLTSFLLVTLAFTATVALADESAAKKSIEAQYNKLATALDNKDLKAIQSVGTNDFRIVPPHEKPMDRAAVAAALTQMFVVTVRSRSRFHIDSIRVRGNSATVVSTSVTSSTVHDKSGMYGNPAKMHRVVDTMRSTDTWVKTGGVWKLRVEKALSDNETVDGKSTRMPMAPAPKHK